jgi:hypothetical protein
VKGKEIMTRERLFATPGLLYLAQEVDAECVRQTERFGDPAYPNGTGRPGDEEERDRLHAICKANTPEQDNWRDILAEEIAEVFAETDTTRLRAELIQAQAVITKWIAKIDRRGETE